MRNLKALVIGLIFLGPNLGHAEGPLANPDAVAAYSEGMRLLSTSQHRSDWDKAKRLFHHAADLDLPHGLYGLACVVYKKRDSIRYSSAYTYAKQAAAANVIEAQALLASYTWYGLGTGKNRTAAHGILVSVAQKLGSGYPITSGASDTVSIRNPEEAQSLLNDVLRTGTCGPELPLDQVLAEGGGYLNSRPHKYYGPTDDPPK